MSSRAVSPLVVGLVCAALAWSASAEDGKVYRWVGEDGHVYTSNTPPPDGRGMIDAPPPAPAKPAPAPAPARRSAPSAAPAAPARGAPDVAPAEGTDCARFDGYVTNWRKAQQSIADWEATIDRLESQTDGFMRRNDTAYSNSIDRANEHLEQARDRASQIEAQGRAAGMPQSCLSE